MPKIGEAERSTYLGLIQDLLGSPTSLERSNVLPSEVKYVLVALSCTEGPLNELLVTSGVLTEATPTPARLSLLPRAAVWAGHAIEACSADTVPTARIAEASGTTQFLDLKPATEWGCTAFLSLAASLSSDTAVAIVFGFKRRADCTPAAANAAKLVLDTASSRCPDLISNILAITEMLVSPPPLPEALNHGVDDEDDDDFIEEEWEVFEEDEPRPEVACNRFTLQFKDQRIERSFAAIHNSNLARMDIAGYLLCMCSAIYILFVPHTAFNKAASFEGVQAWRSTFGFLPIVLLLNPRTRGFYFRHRETFITFIFCATLLWQLHVKHYIDCVTTETFTRALYLHGYSWLGVMVLMFQLRFKLALPLVLTCFVPDLTLVPAICSRFYPEQSLISCVGFDVLRIGFWVVAFPLCLSRWMEKRCRDIFLRRMHED